MTLKTEELQQNYRKDLKLFDTHVHVWGMKYVENFIQSMKSFGVDGFLAMGGLKLKRKFADLQIENEFIPSYYLDSNSFVSFNVEKLCNQIEQAQNHEINVLKIFFGPRLLMFSRRKNPFRINDSKLEPVYSLIEDNDMNILIHVADPDIWYQKKYKNTKKYGTKDERLQDFETLLEMFPKIKMISAHFGSLPENLPRLGELLNNYPQLFVDTASTRWIIRELGKNIENTKKWIEKYQDRIIFGSDLGNIEFHPKFFFSKRRREFYWSSRYCSQRLFWESSEKRPLLFKDKDNPEGTVINGLNLPNEIIEKIYLKNAQNFFLR